MRVKMTICVRKSSGIPKIKLEKKKEQDGRGVGGCGVCLSLQIHHKYTFRQRSACRTPGESGQEYLTSGKEYIESHKT